MGPFCPLHTPLHRRWCSFRGAELMQELLSVIIQIYEIVNLRKFTVNYKI